MKIVDRKTFLSLPSGTLFSKWRPLVMDALEIKLETLGDDYYYQSLDTVQSEADQPYTDALDRLDDGDSIQVDLHDANRDGMFDAD